MFNFSKRLTSRLRGLKALLGCFFVKHQPKFLFLLCILFVISFVNEILGETDLPVLPVKSRIFILWFFIVFLFRLSAKVSLAIAVALVFCFPALFVLGYGGFAEQLAVLTYFFIILGVTQRIFELSRLTRRRGNE